MILEGPEPLRRTPVQYTGRRVDRERRAYKQAYRRVWREAMRDARGALIDLSFLAEHAEADWLYDLVTTNEPLYELTDEAEGTKDYRSRVNVMGYDAAPLEALLRSLAGRVAWERWPTVTKEKPDAEAVSGRGGSFVVVHLAAALEEGLNSEAAAASHLVQIVNREPTPTAWPPRAPRLA
ncbi:MAG: hypothetical protein V4510_03570 [bacterium]